MGHGPVMGHGMGHGWVIASLTYAKERRMQMKAPGRPPPIAQNSKQKAPGRKEQREEGREKIQQEVRKLVPQVRGALFEPGLGTYC